MENMESRLIPPSEGAEDEPDPLKAKVETWMKEYAATHADTTVKPYEISPAVQDWLAAYKVREEDLYSLDLSRHEWTARRKALQAEYDAKMQEPDFRLAVLRQAPEPDEYSIERLERQLRKAAEEKWWVDNKDVIPPRNLITHFDETATALADIEGAGWAQGQNREDYSLLGALQFLRDHPPAPEVDRNVHYVVYGSGGFNRWYVTQDGQVEFSKMHGTDGFMSKEDVAAKISRRGFPIFQ